MESIQNFQSVRTDRFEMHYCKFGSGKRTFVLIPGVSLKSVLPNAEGVAAVLADFTDRYTCYLFDRTENMPEGYTTMQMAEDTAEAMKLLGISGADLFGASHGGMMAMCIAAYHPELVRKLVLASSMPRQNEMSRKTFDLWYKLAKEGDAGALNRAMMPMIYSKQFMEDHKADFDAAEQDGTPEEMRRFAILAKACRTHDIYEELGRIRCPVLAIGEKNDRVLSWIGTKEIAEKLNCEVYYYDGFSHAVFDEAPGYYSRVLEFLEK